MTSSPYTANTMNRKQQQNKDAKINFRVLDDPLNMLDKEPFIHA